MTVYLIDTFSFLFKSYYALPDLRNREDFPTAVITGFFKTLMMFRKNFGTENLVFAYEGGDGNFRKEITKSYKADRGEVPDDFRVQFEIIKDLIEKMGFRSVSVRKHEADDVIATLSKKFLEKDYKVVILGEDKDLNQLLTNENISIYKIEKSNKTVPFGREDVKKKFGIYPEQFIDFQALVGDPVDGVKGVKGIGKVGASKLLNEFGSLDGIYENLDKIKGANRKKLEAKEDAYESQKLVKLVDNLEIDIENFQNKVEEPFLNIVDEVLELEIKDPIEFLKKNKLISNEELQKKDSKNFKFEFEIVSNIEQLKTILSEIPEKTLVALDTETTGISSLKDSLVGISFTDKENFGYYIPIAHNSFFNEYDQISISELKEVISEFNRFDLIGHNWKFDSNILWKTFGVDLNFVADTMVLAWLNDSRESLSLDNLSYKFLKHKTIKFSEIVKKGENFSSVEIDVAGKYAVEDVVATLKLHKFLKNNLSDEMSSLAENLENDISKIISKMERAGIGIDVEYLEEVQKDLQNEIAEISNKIFDISKKEFNLNSPKQVSSALYEIVGEQKTTKTDEATLRELLQKFETKDGVEKEFIELILKYRELQKLLSTYAIPLVEKSVDGRIHTNFNQTGTATGRFSSTDPNLQNIPVGKKIRRAFVSKNGYSLLSLDYSQIELRLLAHFSNEKTLIELFKNGKDVHQYLADELKVERSVAKTVNFGVIYGMGSTKLSKTLNISIEEAKRIIDGFFELYPAIAKYKDVAENEQLQIINKEILSTTLLNRIRYFNLTKIRGDEVLREAFNTIFQGSTADLVKLSMKAIDDEISEKNLDVKMLLQIHDELIFEVKDEIVDEVKTRFIEIMENCYKLQVPLKVNSKSAKSWGTLEIF
jgi:DNA polymerase-1